MSESDYIQQIDAHWQDPDLSQAKQLVDEALNRHPHSPKLLCMKGDLIQRMWAAPADYPLEEAKACYSMAIQCEPTFAEAHQELGICHDLDDKLDLAEQELQNAIQLGAGADSFSHLARVWAQQGRKTSDILDFLSHSPYAQDPIVCKIFREVENGDWEPLTNQQSPGTPPGCT